MRTIRWNLKIETPTPVSHLCLSYVIMVFFSFGWETLSTESNSEKRGFNGKCSRNRGSTAVRHYHSLANWLGKRHGSYKFWPQNANYIVFDWPLCSAKQNGTQHKKRTTKYGQECWQTCVLYRNWHYSSQAHFVVSSVIFHSHSHSTLALFW